MPCVLSNGSLHRASRNLLHTRAEKLQKLEEVSNEFFACSETRGLKKLDGRTVAAKQPLPTHTHTYTQTPHAQLINMGLQPLDKCKPE